MAKGGLSTKLKCLIRRWHSSSRISHTPSVGSHGGEEDPWGRGIASHGSGGGGAASFGADGVPPGLHPVYVGKSRRRYLIPADLVGHPLFQNLVGRSGGGVGGIAGGTIVSCEVVLFEHLLWMLENADPQSESLDELVEYYAC